MKSHAADAFPVSNIAAAIAEPARTLDSRALRLTASGRRELTGRFGLTAESLP